MSEINETKGKKKRTAGDVIRTIIIIIALGVFCYSGYQLITIYLEYKKGVDEYNALNDQYVKEEVAVENIDGTPTMENPIDFAGLKKINEDLIGWISADAVGVSYPIMHGKDNDYYLHRTFEGTYNFAGCIFMDYLNKGNFSDKNSIIYGHNMKNGSMFGSIHKYKNAETYEKDPYFWIYTPDEIYKYEIFAGTEVSVTSKTYQLSFKDDNDFLEYVAACKEKSAVKADVEVTKDDKVVTLSTCTGNDATRFVVQGKLIETYKSK